MLYHVLLYGPEKYTDFAFFLERLTPLLDMFFIVSGFLISVHYSDRLKSFADYRVFLVRRMARLYPLHLLTLAFFCLIWLAVSFGLVSARMTNSYSLVELVKELLLINAWGTSDILTFNYVSWSLSAEWFCYLLFPVILFVRNKGGLWALIMFLMLYIGGMELATDAGVMPIPSWLHADTWGAYRVFADFLAGAIIANLAARRLIRIRSHLLAWSILAMAIIYMLSAPSWSYGPILSIYLACYVAAQVEFNRPEALPFYKPFRPIAAASFGIYLWHPVLASVVIGLLWNRFLAPMGIMSFVTAAIGAMILTIATALISMLFFEKPMHRAILFLAEKAACWRQGKKEEPLTVVAK